MSSVILSKTYAEPPFCEREILRYAGCKEADGETAALLKDCIEEVRDKLTYKVCYREYDVTVEGDICELSDLRLRSRDLAANLKDSKRAVVFAATVGVGIDRLIAKYGRISPARALIFQAIGAERIEALCDRFCEDIGAEMNAKLRPRFSPGYGDLPLEAQKELFSVLEPAKRIGLTLTDSMLMSPSKSVTAIVGISGKGEKVINKCSMCDKSDCVFRGAK